MILKYKINTKLALRDFKNTFPSAWGQGFNGFPSKNNRTHMKCPKVSPPPSKNKCLRGEKSPLTIQNLQSYVFRLQRKSTEDIFKPNLNPPLPHTSSFCFPREHSKCHRSKSVFSVHIGGLKAVRSLPFCQMDNDRWNVYGVSVDEGFFASSHEDGGQRISVLHVHIAKRNTPCHRRSSKNKQSQMLLWFTSGHFSKRCTRMWIEWRGSQQLGEK